jgi:hypothetical protein
VPPLSRPSLVTAKGRSLPDLMYSIVPGMLPKITCTRAHTKKRPVDYLAENIWVTTSGNFNAQAKMGHGQTP